MGGWMGWWVDRQLGGWVDGLVGGWTVRWVDGWMGSREDTLAVTVWGPHVPHGGGRPRWGCTFKARLLLLPRLLGIPCH